MNMNLRQKFSPNQNPTERELLIGARGIMIEGAVHQLFMQSQQTIL